MSVFFMAFSWELTKAQLSDTYIYTYNMLRMPFRSNFILIKWYTYFLILLSLLVLWKKTIIKRKYNKDVRIKVFLVNAFCVIRLWPKMVRYMKMIEGGIWVVSPAAPLSPLGDQLSAAAVITSFPNEDREASSCDSASSYTFQEST